MSLVSLQASYQKPVWLHNYLTYTNLSNFIRLKVLGPNNFEDLKILKGKFFNLRGVISTLLSMHAASNQNTTLLHLTLKKKTRNQMIESTSFSNS